MLNSCASGITVVNIDNGFSAAVTATIINRKIDGVEVRCGDRAGHPKAPAAPGGGHKGTFGRVLYRRRQRRHDRGRRPGRPSGAAGRVRDWCAWPPPGVPCRSSRPSSPATRPSRSPEDSDGRVSARPSTPSQRRPGERRRGHSGRAWARASGLQRFIETLLQQEGLRLLIDGDGLNNLSRLPDWPRDAGRTWSS